jgi:hypothetical protein
MSKTFSDNNNIKKMLRSPQNFSFKIRTFPLPPSFSLRVKCPTSSEENKYETKNHYCDLPEMSRRRLSFTTHLLSLDSNFSLLLVNKLMLLGGLLLLTMRAAARVVHTLNAPHINANAMLSTTTTTRSMLFGFVFLYVTTQLRAHEDIDVVRRFFAVG